MEKQSFKNHIRYYPPHHFVFYPLVMTLLAFSLYFAFTSDNKLIWAFISAVFIVLFCLAFMMRQHYAITLQNRIVRLEVQYRYFSITGKRLETLAPLQDEQLFALRFCSDDALKELVERTLIQNLTGIEIKKAIKNWKGDYNRI